MKRRLLLLWCFILFVFKGYAQQNPSADEVIERYVEVIGGKERWATVKTSEFHGTATIADKNFDMIIIKAGNGNYYQSMIGPNFSSIAVYESGNITSIQNGQKQQLDDVTALDHYQLQSYILPDLMYKSLNYKRELLGNKVVNQKECYEIRLTSPKGSVNLNYYDKLSGLLIMVEKGGVKTFLSNYKFHNGCSIPYTMATDLGEGYQMNIQVNDWLINENSSLKTFEALKQQAIR